MAIESHITQNFQELVRAILQGDVGLMECRDAKTLEPVTIICVFQRNDDSTITTIPVASMFMSDPYEQLIPPTIASDRAH
jgi:hypothetical protein